MSLPVRLQDGDELVAVLKRQGADAGLAGGIEGVEPDALDGAAARDHHQVLMVREFARQQHGRHALALLERQDIDDVRAARRAPRPPG